MRTLLTPILLGGAVAATTLPLPAEGDDPVKEEKKAEDPLLTRLRQEIPSLIADLDKSHFRDRERAQRRLQEMSIEWVKNKQTPFPLLSLLQRKDEHSSEQRRRLESVSEVYEREAIELLWLPTKFREPAEWKARKAPLLVSDVLKELGHQTRQEFHVHATDEWLRGGITFDGRTFWGVLDELQKRTVRPLGTERRNDDSLQLVSYWKGCWNKIASRGSVGANFQIDPHAHRAWLSIDAEPNLRIGKLKLIDAVGKTNTGIRIEPYEPVRSAEIGRAFCLYIPHVPGAKTADVTFTVEVEAYRPRTVPIGDLTKAQRIKNNVFDFEYIRTQGPKARSVDGKTVVWQVHGTSEVPWEKRDLFNLVRCKAFDAKNQPIPWYGSNASSGGGPFEYQWEFVEEPHRLEYSVPDRSTKRTLTFEFSGVPLPQQ